MEKVVAFRSSYNDEVHYMEDCVGMGNPPSCPAYQRDNPGGGTLAMERVMVEREVVPKEEDNA